MESVGLRYPELAMEWSERNYPLRPEQVSYGSHKRVWWKGRCGREWSAEVKNRTLKDSGCPYCSHRALLRGFNDLASQVPELVAEWSEKNSLSPDEVMAFSNRKVWWKCKAGHEWSARIADRSCGCGCPYCAGQILLKGFNDLATKHPALSEEWSERNLPLMPDQVSEKSRQNVWWKCRECGYEWKAVIWSRVKGQSCPVCAERTVLTGRNDLAATDSLLVTEWDYERNRDIKPTGIARESMKSVWWRCPQGHSWKSKIAERTIGGIGCRVCEAEFQRAFPQLIVELYAKRKGMHVERNGEEMFGVPISAYIPEEKLAIDWGDSSEKRLQLKEFICRRRGIKLMRLSVKEKSDEEIAMAVKKIFQKVHVFIVSDTGKDVAQIRKIYEKWNNQPKVEG